MDRITRGDALAGAFFLLAAAVYQPLLTDPGGYLTDAARGDGAVLGGAFLEALLVVGVVGTAVCLYPLVRRHGEGARRAAERHHRPARGGEDDVDLVRAESPRSSSLANGLS